MASILDPEIRFQELENLLIQFAFEHYWGKKWRGDNLPKEWFRSVASNVERLSDEFTLHRRDFKGGYLRTKEGRSAYLLYFHLASVARILAVFEELHRRKRWRWKEPKVLDLGCGTGAGAWAAALFSRLRGGEPPSVLAWDRERSVLQDASALWKMFCQSYRLGSAPFQTRTVDLFRYPRPRDDQERVDLIICSNVVNELQGWPVERRRGMISDLLSKWLNPGGVVVLVEPALKRSSKNLTKLRDEVLGTTNVHAPIPCGHEQECPLNEEPRDWCHFVVGWTAPPLRSRLEKFMEHATGQLKYSYLVFENDPHPDLQSTYRVISDPLSVREGDFVLACTPKRKTALGYERRTKTGDLLRSTQRGDLLSTSLDTLKRDTKSHGYADFVRVPPNWNISKV